MTDITATAGDMPQRKQGRLSLAFNKVAQVAKKALVITMIALTLANAAMGSYAHADDTWYNNQNGQETATQTYAKPWAGDPAYQREVANATSIYNANMRSIDAGSNYAKANCGAQFMNQQGYLAQSFRNVTNGGSNGLINMAIGALTEASSVASGQACTSGADANIIQQQANQQNAYTQAINSIDQRYEQKYASGYQQPTGQYQVTRTASRLDQQKIQSCEQREMQAFNQGRDLSPNDICYAQGFLRPPVR